MLFRKLSKLLALLACLVLGGSAAGQVRSESDHRTPATGEPTQTPAAGKALLEVDRTAWFREAKFGLFIHWGPYSRASVEASWPIIKDTPHKQRAQTSNPLESRPNRVYHASMAKTKESELEKPAPVLDDEDEETLAAIDEGMRDAKAGRTVTPEEVRKLLPQWITTSSTRKGR